MGSGNNPTGQKQNETETTIKEIISQNKFAMLSNPEEQAPILEEGEVQQSQGMIREEIAVASTILVRLLMAPPLHMQKWQKINPWILLIQKKNIKIGTLKKGKNISRRFERKKFNA